MGTRSSMTCAKLSSVLLSGPTKATWLKRCAFSTWCPKAIALIGNLPPTLNDRSILISMVRKKKSQSVERFSLGNDYQDLEELRQKCLRWATDNMEELKKADPDMPNELGDRT